MEASPRMVATKISYRAERLAPGEARAELLRLWDDNLQVEGGVDRKFAWLYEEAPDRPEAVFLLAADDAGDRRWVGTAGVGVRWIQVGDRRLRAGLLGDLAVDRAHRTVMPALSLVRTVKAWALGEGGCDLAYGFPNHHAEGVFKRVGYAPLGTIGRWARVLRHASYAARVKETELPGVPPAVKRVVERIVEVPAVAAAAGAAVDVLRLAQRAPATLGAARRIAVTWLPSAAARPDAFDRLWEAAARDHDVVGARTARLLAWRFPASPRLAIALATSRTDGAPLAYAVVEQVDGVAHVRDLFGHRDGIVALLDRLPPALYARGAASVSIRYLGARWLVEALEARGFVPRASSRMVTVGVRDGIDEATRAALTDAARWHMTDADEDV